MAASSPITSTVLAGLTRIQSTGVGPQHPTNSYIWESPNGAIVIDPHADTRPVGDDTFALFATHVQQEHVAGAANSPRAMLYVPVFQEYLCEGAVAYANKVQKWK